MRGDFELPQASNHVHRMIVNSHTCEEGVGENPSERERGREKMIAYKINTMSWNVKSWQLFGMEPRGLWHEESNPQGFGLSCSTSLGVWE